MANEITDKWALTGLLDTIPLINQDVVAASLEEMELLLKANAEDGSLLYDDRLYSVFVPSTILRVIIDIYDAKPKKIPKADKMLKDYFKYVKDDKILKSKNIIDYDYERESSIGYIGTLL